MPYFKIETNQILDDQATKQFLMDASAFASQMLGKPEKVMMVSVDPDKSMLFNKETGPIAYVQLKSIGLTEDMCPGYAKEICEFIENKLNVSPDRIYIDFGSINGKMFGWNKKTF